MEWFPLLRSAFIALSRNKPLRAFSERSSMGRRMSSRFVAGLTIEDALRAAESVQAQGMSSSLDSLGENVSSPEEAHRAADIYHRLLDEIQGRGLKSNVSVKLTQVGMDLDPGLAESIVRDMVDHAAYVDSFVRVDMEGTPYTEATIALVERLHSGVSGQDLPRFGRVGTVIQSYLRRSEGDIDRLLAQGIRIRLCKGAYKEGPEHAFPSKAEVDANYVKLMKKLVTFRSASDGKQTGNPAKNRSARRSGTGRGNGVFCGMATHDPAIIDQMKQFVAERGIDKASFEFQMLYGIRRDLQKQLIQEGFGVRVYIPFGTEWYPYFMRRLAERPANVLFIAKQMLRK